MTLDRRGFVRAGVVLGAGVAAANVLDGCKLESRRELADHGFLQLRDEYFRWQLARNPVTSTYLGGDGWDATLVPLNGRLRDYSAGALADEARVLARIDRSHDASEPAPLMPAHRIDHAVIDAQVAVLRLQNDRRYHERSIDTYVAEP